MDCSKEINEIFNKWRLQNFSISFENQALEQRPEISHDGIFNCDSCTSKFKTLKDFKSHTKHVHIKPYKCIVCSYSCGGNSNLQKHVATKHNNSDRKARPEEIIFKCEICLKEFQKLVLYTRHRRSVHIKPNKCQECNNQFGSPYQLKQHVIEKHVGLAIKCNICDKVLASEKTFKKHMFVHSNESHDCENCEYTARSKFHMKLHIQSNHSEIDFQCTLCKSKYKSKSKLRCHVRIKHENAEKIKCELCDFASHHKSTMRIHNANIHDGQRFTCDECQQSFYVGTRLSKHKQVYHSNNFIKCEDCSYVTKNDQALKYHKEAEHEGIRYKCTDCPMETRNKHYLNKHIKEIHTDPEFHICDQCNFKTNKKQSLLRHVKIHGDKLACDKCPYKTTFKSLLRSHTEVEHLGLGHACNICGVRKTRKCYLDQHMKSKHKAESK